MSKEEIDKEERKKKFSKSLKAIVLASAVLLATKVPAAYIPELAEDSTAVNELTGGSVDVAHSSHSSHSSRSWR